MLDSSVLFTSWIGSWLIYTCCSLLIFETLYCEPVNLVALALNPSSSILNAI